MVEPATSVQSGDIITSALMNQVLERLDVLEGETAFLLGSVGMDTHTLVAIGSGFEAGGGIWLDGQLLSGQPVRGINLVILDPTLKIKYQGTYDTADDPQNSIQLADDLQNRTSIGDIVIAVSHEVYATQLEQNGRAELASIGGATVGEVAGTTAAAAFIGLVPANRSGLSFDYLVSVTPTDASSQIAGAPFAWGLYSSGLQTFLAGQAGNKPWFGTSRQTVESPPAGGSGVAISAVALKPQAIATATSVTGAIDLDASAPSGGITATLSSSNPQVATVQGSISIPEGQTTAPFTVTAVTPGSASIIVSIPGVAPRSATVTVVQALALVSVEFTPTTASPNGTVIGTVTLNGPAPTGGATVTLTSDTPRVAAVQGSLSIPAGQQSGTFPVTTGTPGTATISASLPGAQPQTAVLTVTPALAIASLTLNPSPVMTGGTVTGTVTLTGPAPSGGMTIALSSSNTQVAQVQPSITILPGGSSIPFTVTIGTPGIATIAATLPGSSPQSAPLTVTTPLALASFTLSSTTAASGAQVTGTVTLNIPAPMGGVTISLASDNPQVAVVQGSVSIPAGQQSAAFPVTAGSPGTATISALLPGAQTLTFGLTVTPLLASLVLNPRIVTLPAASTGTITLNGPAPPSGLTVALSSTNGQVAAVPASVDVGAGQTTMTFPVTAIAAGTTNVTGSVPGSPAQSDMLTVQRQKGGKEGKEVTKETKDAREHKLAVEVPPIHLPGQSRGRVDASLRPHMQQDGMSQTGETGASWRS